MSNNDYNEDDDCDDSTNNRCGLPPLTSWKARPSELDDTYWLKLKEVFFSSSMLFLVMIIMISLTPSYSHSSNWKGLRESGRHRLDAGRGCGEERKRRSSWGNFCLYHRFVCWYHILIKVSFIGLLKTSCIITNPNESENSIDINGFSSTRRAV